MIYEPHLAAAESSGWTLASIAWDRIDREVAARETHIHRALHDAALIEGYLPVVGAELLQALRDDVDATAVISIELFEGLRHYTALKRYLHCVGFEDAAAADQGLAVARVAAAQQARSPEPVVARLTHFMGSELFAAYFFLRFAEQSEEPVLRDLLRRMSADEMRHAAAASALLEARVARDPGAAALVAETARAFRHYGSDIVDVPVAQANDFEAIAAFNRRIQLICRRQ